MTRRLLATKFHIPPGRPGLVARARLLERLQQGLHEQHKLTLVSAPAGYGKTTLVTEWLGGLSIPTAWLSLDEADDDPLRFMRYFMGAFQQVDGAPGGQVLDVLEMPGQPDFTSLTDMLLNDLVDADVPLVLVLDDYHVIRNPQIHAVVEYFVEHKPTPTHLVLTTRADPPLPLARMRARHQMTEIRARDLRFTTEEARAFFGLANLPLAESALRALDQRTEGWAAGLQLAVLALQHQPDPAAFIETFRGSHRYVLDYLAGEVIHQQGDDLRAFLTRTCVLARFNADLCNALTGRDDSQGVINHLEQSNLFIIPLDDDRRWYRYHHLFADYLHSLLPREDQAVLYRKAAVWHEEQDLAVEAVRYALLAADPDFAAQVIENALGKNSTWSDGNLAQLVAWLEALPGAVFEHRPCLGLHAVRVFYLEGRFDRAVEYLDRVEHTLLSAPDTAENDQLRALAILNRGAIAAVRGEFQQAITLVPAARVRISLDNHLAHARAFFSLGLAYELTGQTGLAVENYLHSSAEARTAGVLFLDVHGLCSAAQLQISQGRLTQAWQTCHQAIRQAEGAHLPPLGLAWSILGAIALERNDLNTAERHLQDGLALSRQGGLRDDQVVGLAALGRLRGYQGDMAGVQGVIEEVLSILQVLGVPRSQQIAHAHMARYQHFLGHHEAALKWAEEYRSERATIRGEFEELTLARILLRSGELELVADILHPILEQAEAAGRGQAVLEAMLLLGLYYHACGQKTTAQSCLIKSLERAAPEGYFRIFLDEGPALLELLPPVRHVAPELVDALHKYSPGENPPAVALIESLPDPLSEQELRVLRLIVAGKSNAEIAAELVISVGTAKWHVHNVLQKLGVGNRPQAIARARELGI